MQHPFAEYNLPEPWYPTAFPWQPGQLLAGVDEVGRGPLVGAVVTAAVILDPSNPIAGLADSKKLSEKKRNELAEEIRIKALAVSVGRADAAEVDQLNIYQATFLAMQRAVTGLKITPDAAIIDGHRCPDLPMPAEAVVKGDGRVPAISAASIIAKVTRDAEMLALHQEHPNYGFDRHKGYPTKAHIAALNEYGALPEHRRSFAPVARVVDPES
ncbi:MAG TPA: ribonuclease HII [Alcanivoracaceae bacterium]|nr:ribonuclease HII [Alcanivoracaceae bacterium]